LCFMANAHRWKSRTIRPPDGEWDAAVEALEGLQILSFMRAAFRALAADRAATMAFLRPHWPEDEKDRPVRRKTGEYPFVTAPPRPPRGPRSE
jgi:hypothetical protein